MKKVQEEAKAILEIANENMKQFYNRRVTDTPEYKKGDLVWLDVKNIKHHWHLNQKLLDH